MEVLGDQLAQDTHCGRMKQNSGGAGRIHRNCMCSYLNADNPHVSCESVDMILIEFLSCKAILSDDQLMTCLSNQKSHLKLKLTSKEEKQSFCTSNVKGKCLPTY